MTIYKKGLNVGELILILKLLPKNKKILLSSDEEQNTLFKGFYIEHYEDSVTFAGLSGCEEEY